MTDLNQRDQAVEDAIAEVLRNFDLKKLDELRVEFGNDDFDYDGNQILNELVQDVKSNLMHRHSSDEDLKSISHNMKALDDLHEIYDDVDFKSNILFSLKNS